VASPAAAIAEARIMTSRRLVLFTFSVFASLSFGQDPKTDSLPKNSDERRDQTNLRRVTEKVFVHDLAGIAFKIPEKWEELPPHRLARKIDQRVSTVLSIHQRDADVAASLSWIPLNPGQKLSEFVTDTPIAGEYGEEYETLRVVYGKDRVSLPVKIKPGEFEIYRININGGPEKGEKYDGTLFLNEVQNGERTWMLKARISFPKGDRTKYDQLAMDVLRGYSRVPAKGGKGPK
jgi:hypothetical protein